MTPLSRALAVLAAAALAAAPAPAPQGGHKPALKITCTPQTYQIGSEPPVQARNTIAAALERAGPGSIIEVLPGGYAAFGVGFNKSAHWNARTSGGRPGQPIVVRALGKVTIDPGNSGDAISIGQEIKNGHITFEGLEIVPGYRAAVIFYKAGPDQVYEGYRFLDCDIAGSWDHLGGGGRNSKWGVWGHSLKDFEWRGLRGRSQVRNLRHEHGFYLQNPKGDITIENVDASRLGRTFVQLTARPSDGGPGVGRITVRNCRVEDCGIAAGDNFKGGSAFTVSGRLAGPLLFERNTYRAGFDPALRRLTHGEAPYGTGAFVAWDGGGEPNGELVLRDNDFAFAPGCGDRAVVSIGGCRQVRIVGENRFVSGADAALELDPLRAGGDGLANSANGAVVVEPGTKIEGPVRLRGEVVGRERLAELAQGE